MPSPLLSIVSPVYKAAEIVEVLVQEIEKAVQTITDDYEIVLVEDGSPDDSWKKMTAVAAENLRVKVIKLSRNFGQHYAITAGLDHVRGEWIVVMDCDLQDRPEEIPNLYEKAVSGGFDIVFASREFRQDNLFKRFTSELFNKVFTYLSGVPRDARIANFGIYNRKVIKSINLMREPMRAFSPMIQWVGFSKTAISVRHGKRFAGDSSYTWSKLINLATDISVSYSDRPLQIIIKIGTGISLCSFLFSILIFIEYLRGGIHVSGYASLILAVCFLSGLIILFLGIIGLYLSKIFDGVKSRPLYLIDQSINLE